MKSGDINKKERLHKKLSELRAQKSLDVLLTKLRDHYPTYNNREWEKITNDLDAQYQQAFHNLNDATLTAFEVYVTNLKKKLAQTYEDAKFNVEFQPLVKTLNMELPDLLAGKSLEDQMKLSQKIMDIQAEALKKRDAYILEDFLEGLLRKQIEDPVDAAINDAKALIKQLSAMPSTAAERDAVRTQCEKELKPLEETGNLESLREHIVTLNLKIFREQKKQESKQAAEAAPAKPREYFGSKKNVPAEPGQESDTLNPAAKPPSSPSGRSKR